MPRNQKNQPFKSTLDPADIVPIRSGENEAQISAEDFLKDVLTDADIGNQPGNLVVLGSNSKIDDIYLPTQSGGGITQETDPLSLHKDQNLSDLNDVIAARTNLGLGTAAIRNSGNASGNVPLLDGNGKLTPSVETDPLALKIESNLSDLSNVGSARTNLGLGTAATQNVGTAANNVVQLDGTGKLPAVDASQVTNASANKLSGSATSDINMTNYSLLYNNNFGVKDRFGNSMLQYSASSSAAVNFIKLGNAPTNNNPLVLAQGTDANVGIEFLTKGTGSIVLPKTNISALDATLSADLKLPTTTSIAESSGAKIMQFYAGATSVNYFQVAATVSGLALNIIAAGSDANINIALTPKGNGRVVVNRPNVVNGFTESSTAVSVSSGAAVINLNNGNLFSLVKPASALTISFTLPTFSGLAGMFFLLQLQNGGSTGSISWPTSVKWAGGTMPALTAAGYDILSFQTFDNGNRWEGMLVSKDSK